jgi:DNA-binding phage protein
MICIRHEHSSQRVHHAPWEKSISRLAESSRPTNPGAHSGKGAAIRGWKPGRSQIRRRWGLGGALKFGPRYRLYFGKDGLSAILLLIGGDKASQSKNIGATQSYWADYKKMAKRSKDWNIGLAQDLSNPEFAREFLLAAIDDGVSVQIALGKAIRAIGVKEFSAKIAVESPNVLRAINPRHNPTQDTLNRLLKPFKLKLSLAPIDQPKRRRAA